MSTRVYSKRERLLKRQEKRAKRLQRRKSKRRMTVHLADAGK
jgi:hypothetical protein